MAQPVADRAHDATRMIRRASGSAKINPLIPAFNAIALMSSSPWSTQASIFVIWARDR
jgi:hypothetical protein